MLFCLGDVPATNIFNYDETNLQDDPGRNWVFVRRGRKRVETVKDTSKTSVSVMWCGSAAGECLPPMVVYKAKICTRAGFRVGYKIPFMIVPSLDGLIQARSKSGFLKFLWKKSKKTQGNMYYLETTWPPISTLIL